MPTLGIPTSQPYKVHEFRIMRGEKGEKKKKKKKQKTPPRTGPGLVGRQSDDNGERGPETNKKKDIISN